MNIQIQNRRNGIYLLLILCLLAGLFTGRTFFFNIAYLFTGLMAIAYLWAWLAVRWISINRKTRTRRAQVGRTVSESFSVRNLSIIPKLWLEIRDQSNLPNHRASHIVPWMHGRATYRWSVETMCVARGQYRLGPISVISGDPFGFYISPRLIAATSTLIVYPMTVPIDKFELPAGLLSGGEAQRQRSHNVTTNAAGVRDYAYGDSFNRIHWRSSARKDRLIVKEFEIDPLVDIWIIPDFSRSSLAEVPGLKRTEGTSGYILPSEPGLPPSTEEYTVVTAASLAEYFVNLERAVGFAAYAPNREVHQPERGKRQITHIFETLAVARSLSDYTFAQMLTLETPYLTRGTTLILITSSLDPTWVTEAEILSRRGMRPMAVFIDPTSFENNRSSQEVRDRLHISRIPHLVIHRGENLASALSQRLS
jgi:uncharacterized protein (DUF58 family)